jgi:hypothetical protein
LFIYQSEPRGFILTGSLQFPTIFSKFKPTINETRLRKFSKLTLQLLNTLLQVKICGHATLAAAHTLFATSFINSNTVEFLTASGILTARKVTEIKTSSGSTLIIQNDESQESFFIESDPVTDFNPTEFSSISKALNAASVIDIKRTSTEDDLIVMPPYHFLSDLVFVFDTYGSRYHNYNSETLI